MVDFGGELMSRLKTKMAWHQDRTTLLARNVANSETPGFQPQDLRSIDFSRHMGTSSGLGLEATNIRHLTSDGSSSASFDQQMKGDFEVVKGGNGVTLETEMAKVAQNQLDHEAVTGVYQRMIGLFRLANRR